MAELNLDAIKARLAAASEGPWSWGEDGLVWAPRLGDPVSGSTEVEDAAFIAHAREDIPALVAEVEKLREELRIFKPDASRQLSDAYARRIDELAAARLGHVGDREDPETGAPLPAGVEGVSIGRANNGTAKTAMALTPDDPALPDEPVTDAERVSAAIDDKAAETAGEVA